MFDCRFMYERILRRASHFKLPSLAILLYSLLLRIPFIQGYGLGDDSAYLDLILQLLNGHYPEVKTIGQYPYRPAWLIPLWLSVSLLGWSDFSLVAYPLLCGVVTPPLMYFWLVSLPSRKVRRVAFISSLIFATFPSTIFHSTVLSNDTCMFFWVILSSVYFGKTLQAIFSGGNKVTAVTFLLISSFAALLAYQVKVSALPTLAIYYSISLALLAIAHRRDCLRILISKITFLSAALYALPFIGIQLIYLLRTGDLFGNIRGEILFYERSIPERYYSGGISNDSILDIYPRSLLFSEGFPDYRFFYSSIFIWLSLAIAILWVAILLLHPMFSTHSLKSKKRRIIWASTPLIFYTASLLFYLFLQYWPAKSHPFYLPNNFTGRSERYIIPLLPLLIASSCVAALGIREVLPNPWRTYFGNLSFLVLLVAVSFAGYSTKIVDFVQRDKRSDMKVLASFLEANVTPCRDRPFIIDIDGRNHLLFEMKMKAQFQSLFFIGDDFNLQQLEGCILAGGSRRYAISSPPKIELDRFKMEYDFEVIFQAPFRPEAWRLSPMQLIHFKKKASSL